MHLVCGMVDRFRSIHDVRMYRHVDYSRYLDTGNSVTHNRHSILVSNNSYRFAKMRCVKPLSHWDATSSRLFCESIRELVSKPFAWQRKVLDCIANCSRTVRESFKYEGLFRATKNHRKIVARSSQVSRIRRQPFANVRRHIAI